MLDFFVQLLRDPGHLIAWGGYPALGAVIFLETGLLVFFLPGDSLLFIAGLLAARGELSLLTLNLLLGPLAVLGDACSYALGRRFGKQLADRPPGRLLRPAHVRAAEDFYRTHGGKAIIMARFVPVVRTFVPVVAGAAGMPYARFFAFNLVGGLGWIGSMTCLGYGLGDRFPGIAAHLELVILAILLASALPAVWQVWQARRAARPTPRN